VENKDVILVDDMIATGGSICKAAQLLMENGAKSVKALCTHPVFSGNAYDNINNSVLQEVIVTDTLPVKTELSEKINVLSVDIMIAKAIRRIVNGNSISKDLFGSI
jgi:ribose-phosphate pyrophosphokinase